jgi:hypothetical protein
MTRASAIHMTACLGGGRGSMLVCCVPLHATMDLHGTTGPILMPYHSDEWGGWVTQLQVVLWPCDAQSLGQL